MSVFFFEDEPYVAVIGDIKQSKEIKERNAAQKILQNKLDEINHMYKNEIASNFMITLGDEFQGLLHSGAFILSIIDEIERAMYPIKLRFGIGVGVISTDINISTPLGADGPAYYLARDAITELKESENKKLAPTRSILLKTTNNTTAAALLNISFSLLTTLKESWTTRQREVISIYTQHSGSTQTEIAQILHVSQSSIQKTLDAANYYTYRAAVDSISLVLAEIRGTTHV